MQTCAVSLKVDSRQIKLQCCPRLECDYLNSGVPRKSNPSDGVGPSTPVSTCLFPGIFSPHSRNNHELRIRFLHLHDNLPPHPPYRCPLRPARDFVRRRCHRRHRFLLPPYPRRRRDNRDRDILEELAYVNPLSGRPRSLTAGGRYSTRLPDQHAHNHHNHHHDQRTRFHPHHAYDDQLSQSHPHHQNPHKATEMTMHYVSPKDTSRITKNTLLRDHVLHSPTKTPSARMQMGSRVLPRHRPRGSPGGPRRRTVSEKSKTGSANGGIASGATGGKGVQRRHTL
ncbi:hypothetical protein BGX38DRAFT_755229 [Terfezia claveryi]|nr:hypothetical protein BGX38DRAFT_755229 [Terfezia claveryi]